MSATGRGAVRHPDDFYQTPGWCVRRYLDYWREEYGYDLTVQRRWLEPSAGNGAIMRAVAAWAPPFAPKWVALDIDPTGPRIARKDFLDKEVSADTKFDLCIGNPPYKLAREFIEKGLTVAHEVAFLLRLNFLESEDRHDLFRKHPCDVHVLPNRPSFRADGHTDATAYAWFEFGGGHGGRMSVLALTSKDERLADRVQAA